MIAIGILKVHGVHTGRKGVTMFRRLKKIVRRFYCDWQWTYCELGVPFVNLFAIQDTRYWDCGISLWLNCIRLDRVRSSKICFMFGIWSVEIDFIWALRKRQPSRDGWQVGWYKRENKALKLRGFVIPSGN